MSNLSEEEKKAIETLIEIKEFSKLSSYLDVKIKQLNAIDIVLNLIEKQQKEIEEEHEKWKELLHEYGVKCQEIEELKEEIKRQGNTREIEEEFIEKNFISKDKIREKIKELEQIQNTALTVTTEEIMDYKITILKQLLEE